MTRGPPPRRALGDAVFIARQRGNVQVSERGPENRYDLAITGTSPVAFVRIQYIPRILSSPEDIAAEFRSAVRILRSVTQEVVISCELWLRSKHGTWRFFRVTPDGIIELGRDGKPLGAGGTGSGTVKA